jgi:hypothetical protein
MNISKGSRILKMKKVVKLTVSFLLSIFAVTATAASQVGQIYTGDTINAAIPNLKP